MPSFSPSRRRFFSTGLLILASLLFVGFFNESDRVSPVVQSTIVSLVFFLAIPLLYCKIILKESLDNIGWRRGDIRVGGIVGTVSILVAISILLALLYVFPQFADTYRLPGLVEGSFLWFVLYESVLVGAVTLLYEVFFRGLVQFLWLRNAWWGVLASSGLFIGLLLAGGELSWQIVPIALFTPFSGFIVYRSQSLWYSLAVGWFFFFLADVLILSLR